MNGNFILQISKIIDTSKFLKIIIKNPVLQENLFLVITTINQIMHINWWYNTKFDSEVNYNT